MNLPHLSMLTPYLGLLATAALALFLLVLFLLLLQGRARRRQAEQLEHATRLLHHVKQSAGLENNLNFILEIYSNIIESAGYAFYVRDEQQDKYLLKAVRNRQGKKGADGVEQYHPPMSLPSSAAGPNGRIELTKEGEVPLLSIAVESGKGLIRIGPQKTLPGSTLKRLQYVTGLLPQVLDMLVETDRMKLQTDVVVTSENALRAVSAMALDSEAILKKTLGMFASAMGLSDGFILFQQGGAFQVPVLFGWPGEKAHQILRDREIGLQLYRAVDNKEAAIVRQTNAAYPKLASLMTAGNELLLICRFIESGRTGLLVCRVEQTADGLSEDQLLTSIRTLAQQMSKLLRIQDGLKPATQNYVKLLKLLSRTIDNLNPYTVGYSELCSRYAVIIAQELGMSPREVQDVAMAAYLSNIGVLGLSEDLYLKEGKFSEIEFEKMKLHAAVGAEIVEMLIGNKTVASYIRHHHERMDGHGYPSGLRGQEIPQGARIIGVVQTFLAKINGRKYRAPLSFDKALDLLKSASGSQLDPEAVDALHRWFQRKRSSLRTSNRALGACWEMCCTPSEVCASCPAFQQPEVNCWDVHRNNCQAHGKSCETCFVYTEAVGRGKIGMIG